MTHGVLEAQAAAGVTGLPLPLTVAATLVSSFLFMLGGQAVGAAVERNAQRCGQLGHDEVSMGSAAIFLAVGAAMLLG